MDSNGDPESQPNKGDTMSIENHCSLIHVSSTESYVK